MISTANQYTSNVLPRKMVERQSNEPGCLIDLEDEFIREHGSSGYDTGFEAGQRAGQEEGYSQGLEEGAKRGSEIGFYRGCTMTWIQLIESNLVQTTTTSKSAKILSKLNELLQLVDSYPKTNETLCEEKLSDIRVKFKQSTSILNLKL